MTPQKPIVRSVARTACTSLALLLVLGLAGCGGSDVPPPFASEDSLALRLERDLGAPVYLDLSPRRPYASVASTARVLATGEKRADALLAWITPYAKDLGLDPNNIEVSVEGLDMGGLHHVQVRTKGSFGALDRIDGIDVMTDAEGHFVALSGQLMSDALARAAVTADQAERAAIDAFPGEDGVSNKVLSTTLSILGADGTVSSNDAKLAYRVMTDARLVWVDATTGTVLTSHTHERGILADSVRSTMVGSPFFEAGAKLEVPADPTGTKYALIGSSTGSLISVSSLLGYKNSVPQHSEVLTSASPTSWDTNTLSYQGSYVENGLRRPFALSTDGNAPHLAVDAFHNVALADQFFRKHTFHAPITLGGQFLNERIEVVVHANYYAPSGNVDQNGETAQRARNGAYYHPTTKAIYFGDGSYFFGNLNRSLPSGQVAPLALSLDVIGHELTHAFTENAIGYAGEAGAIDEGIADVVGKLFELEYDRGASTEWMADRAYTERGLRSLAFPQKVGFEVPRDGRGHANHVNRLGCAKITNGKIAYDFPSNDNDNGCVHQNATIVGHAFHLMTFGGTNAESRVVVENPIPFELSRGITLGYISFAQMGPHMKKLMPRTFASLARFQVDSARTVPQPSAANTVACAWHAVGVLDKKYMKEMNFSCKEAPAETCSKRHDGWYCSEAQPFAAYQCKKGSIASGLQCTGDTVCKVANPMTREATLTFGALTCVPSTSR